MGQRVYLDANVFIYWLEDVPGYAEKVEPVFTWLQEGRVAAVTSELSLAEVLQKPIGDSAVQRQRAYEQFLQSRGKFTMAPISRAVLVRAAALRHATRLSLPDAIHAATALEGRAMC